MSVWSRIGNVLRGERLSRDIDEELQSHLAEAIDRGRDPMEARRAFGSALRLREESRDIRFVAWLDSLRADAIFGWRQLLKKKATSAAAVLSLALAIGACTAAFRLIDALLLRPLPVADPARLYVVAFEGAGMDGKGMTYDSCSYPMFRQMRAVVRQQAELVAVSYAERIDLTYKSDQEMEKAYRQFVSGWMFPTFGLRPASGRLLTENDDLKPGAHPVAVLSYDYWSRRFGRDPKAIGRTLRMGTDVYEIVGVTEERFTAMPVKRLEQFFQEKLLLEPASAGRSNLQRDYRTSLAAGGILVALVLLIACANVANLMTARAAARAREMALRVAIGAGRWRLVQLVLVESAWLAFLATGIGALFAWWAAPFIVGMINPPDDPARLVLPADWRVLAFGLALASGVTFLFGLTPALRASAVKPASAMKGGEDPHSRRRLMHALIVLQVAFCFVVHFVAGLFVATFEKLSNQPTGFSAERILNLETVTQHPQPPVFWEQVAEHLRGVPGVEKVALTIWPLMSGESTVDYISIDGAPPTAVFSDFLNVSPGWMDVMRVPLTDGRDFRASDTNPTVAIVNTAFAKQYFNGENPVGKLFEKVDSAGRRFGFQVVGFVRDVRSRDDMRLRIRPMAFVPFQSVDAKGAFQPMGRGTFVVRTSSSNPLAMASFLRREVPRARSEFRVSNIRAQVEINRAHTIRERLLAVLAMFFAGVALLLAGIGLYGVLDYGVLQRRREIGIRIAIGAQAGGISRLVAVDALSMVIVGAVAGLALGMASQRYIAALLYQVKPTDLAMVALPSFTVLAAALLAAIPAVVRALRIDPAAMLRAE